MRFRDCGLCGVGSQAAVWGEDVILEAASLRLPYAARALSYLEVYYVTRDELLDVANFYPTTKRYLRTCVLKLAMRRGIIRLARECRAEQALKSAYQDAKSECERKLARARSLRAMERSMRASRSSRRSMGESSWCSKSAARRSLTSGFDAAFSTVKKLAGGQGVDHTSDASLVSAAGGIGRTGDAARMSMSLAPGRAAPRKLSTLDTRLQKQMLGHGDASEPSCVHATGACMAARQPWTSVHGFGSNPSTPHAAAAPPSGVDGARLNTKVTFVEAEQISIKAELSLMRQGLTRLLEHAGLQPLEPASNQSLDNMSC